MTTLLRSLLVLLLSVGFSGAAFAQAAKQPAPGRTPDVIFVPTPQEVVNEMLKMAKVGKGDVLYDLGSGDGRIPITASASARSASTSIPSASRKPTPTRRRRASATSSPSSRPTSSPRTSARRAS
jgi:hypothetical protein